VVGSSMGIMGMGIGMGMGMGMASWPPGRAMQQSSQTARPPARGPRPPSIESLTGLCVLRLFDPRRRACARRRVAGDGREERANGVIGGASGHVRARLGSLSWRHVCVCGLCTVNCRLPTP
jgi:hypothetical protein